jgi:hypothetical protein
MLSMNHLHHEFITMSVQVNVVGNLSSMPWLLNFDGTH